MTDADKVHILAVTRQTSRYESVSIQKSGFQALIVVDSGMQL